MPENARGRSQPAPAVGFGWKTITAKNSAKPEGGQLCPVERHDPIPTDKSWHAVPKIQLLAGRWQGPGTIAWLRRGARA
jgi:hypothetical protein